MGLTIFSDFATNAQKHAYDMEKEYAQEAHDVFMAKTQYGYDTALKAQQGEIDKALKEQQYGYDSNLATQQHGFDSALSAQEAQQELNKQINQQNYEKMMADTEMQRKIADYKAAGVNPALALGGISNTNAQSSAAQATASAPTNAKESKQNIKAQMNAENMMALTNAIRVAIIKVASKTLGNKAEQLAKHPTNKSMQHNLKRQMMNYYNLVKI